MNGSVAYSRNVNAVVVLRHRLFFPPYYARRIWRANKDCHIETVTDNLERYLSTPASHKSNSLQMFIKCGLSPWNILDPVRLVNDFVAFNHFQQHAARMNMMPSGKTSCARRYWLIKKLSTSVSADEGVDIGTSDLGTVTPGGSTKLGVAIACECVENHNRIFIV